MPRSIRGLVTSGRIVFWQPGPVASGVHSCRYAGAQGLPLRRLSMPLPRSPETALSDLAATVQHSPTGQLRRLPQLPPSEELLGAAKKRLYAMDQAVEEEKKMESRMRRGNARGSWGLPQERKHVTHKIQVLSSSITRPLKDVVEGYRRMMGKLHPFERTVAELTISSRQRNGAMALDTALAHISRLRAEIGTSLKNASMRSSRAESMQELADVMKDALASVDMLVQDRERTIKVVKEYSRNLRSVPVLDDCVPTLVLVGSPNVGKSSLVRALSTGRPEVADYPFTTRGMTIGHVLDATIGFALYQVMDTPGLLPRSQEERNWMEKLTLASMEHIPSTILFVLDMSGTSGSQSSVRAQLQVRSELREMFGDRPWLDVLSKSDLEALPLDSDLHNLMPNDALQVSCSSGEGVAALQGRLLALIPDIPVEDRHAGRGRQQVPGGLQLDA